MPRPSFDPGQQTFDFSELDTKFQFVNGEKECRELLKAFAENDELRDRLVY